MLEVRTSQINENAFRRAHEERAKAVRGMWTWMFGGHSR